MGRESGEAVRIRVIPALELGEPEHRAWAALQEADDAFSSPFFRPEFTVAYEAWIQTDPFRNPKAPPGPSFMPEYRSARLGRARELSAEARKQFERGVATRQTGDEYVRITVFLATVLLLTALAQRFKILGVRVGLLAVASVMLGFALYLIARFPRA